MPKKAAAPPPPKIPKIRQTPAGKWFVQIRLDGKSEYIDGWDYNEVYARALAYKMGIITRRETPERLTLREACHEYIRNNSGRIFPSTAAGYESITRTMFPTLMDRQIGSITKRMLDKAVNDECLRISRRGTPLSPKRVKNGLGFVQTVLREYCPGLDVDVKTPEVPKRPIILPEPADVIRAVIGTPVELPCLLAAWLSFTMSEIRGLTKSKSLQGDYIVIVETLVRVNGVDYRKPYGKEATRTRAVPLPPYLWNLIDKVDGDIIVPATPNSIVRRYRTALDHAGVPFISFHKLRHLNVSLMSQLKVTKAAARMRGGYSNDSIMESVYNNAFDSSLMEADKALTTYFDGVISGHKAPSIPLAKNPLKSIEKHYTKTPEDGANNVPEIPEK